MHLNWLRGWSTVIHILLRCSGGPSPSSAMLPQGIPYTLSVATCYYPTILDIDRCDLSTNQLDGSQGCGLDAAALGGDSARKGHLHCI
ncbi:hypothetical protein EDC04DRAFT_2645059 [Pisolithus marmoratus]|nr:hypothetical protein EDC04DRAFT_2645059 [Pisolithus marmoratus]